MYYNDPKSNVSHHNLIEVHQLLLQREWIPPTSSRATQPNWFIHQPGSQLSKHSECFTSKDRLPCHVKPVWEGRKTPFLLEEEQLAPVLLGGKTGLGQEERDAKGLESSGQNRQDPIPGMVLEEPRSLWGLGRARTKANLLEAVCPWADSPALLSQNPGEMVGPRLRPGGWRLGDIGIVHWQQHWRSFQCCKQEGCEP